MTIKEVLGTAISSNSAAGRDKMTFETWKMLSAPRRALFFNIIMALGGFSPSLLDSRTMFVPKKDGSSAPSDFRPLSIAGLAVRQLHKILARRLMKLKIVDKRQRGLVDECAENITVVSALIADARAKLRELHLLITNIAKAFDSVSRHAIRAVLVEVGLPEKIVNYIMTTYERSATGIEIGKDISHLIAVLSGVHQGDPMSSGIFAKIMDRVISVVPDYIGFFG